MRIRSPMTAWHCTILAWLAACLLAIAPTFSLLHASATVQADPVLCSAGGVRVEAGSARQRTLVLLTSACPLCALQSHLPPWPVLVPQLTMHMVAGLLPLMPALTVTADCALPPATGPPGFVRR